MSDFMSAIGGKADIASGGAMSPFDPSGCGHWYRIRRRVMHQANTLDAEFSENGDLQLHSTTRIPRGTRRRDGRVAARGTGAAGGDAPGRVYPQHVARRWEHLVRAFRQAPKEAGFVEGRTSHWNTFRRRISLIDCELWWPICFWRPVRR